MIQRRAIRSLLAWLTTPMPQWTRSTTPKASALALARMNAAQRGILLRRAALNKGTT